MYRVFITYITLITLLLGCTTPQTPQEPTQNSPNTQNQFKFVVAVIDENTTQPLEATISITQNAAPPIVTIAPTATITTSIGTLLVIEVSAPNYKTYKQRYGLLGENAKQTRLTVRLQREGEPTKTRG